MHCLLGLVKPSIFCWFSKSGSPQVAAYILAGWNLILINQWFLTPEMERCLDYHHIFVQVFCCWWANREVPKWPPTSWQEKIWYWSINDSWHQKYIFVQVFCCWWANREVPKWPPTLLNGWLGQQDNCLCCTLVMMRVLQRYNSVYTVYTKYMCMFENSFAK